MNGKRYAVMLLECPGTSRAYWGKYVAEGDSIAKLFDKFGWGGNLNHDQKWTVHDRKKDVYIAPEEYYTIVRKVKGWPQPQV